jgi:hypothetical protein
VKIDRFPDRNNLAINLVRHAFLMLKLALQCGDCRLKRAVHFAILCSAPIAPTKLEYIDLGGRHRGHERLYDLARVEGMLCSMNKTPIGKAPAHRAKKAEKPERGSKISLYGLSVEDALRAAAKTGRPPPLEPQKPKRQRKKRTKPS